MSSTALSLLNLPLELILEIADYLPADGILALKFSHRILNYSLPLAPLLRKQTPSRCARLAVRGYLAKPTPNPTHLRCILCKAVYPLKNFKSSNSPACAPMSFAANVEQLEVVDLPQRLCAWHVGRLAHVIHTQPGGRNEWVDSQEKMCMHCGAIQAWAKCDCKCDTCSVKPVTAYTRYLNNTTECRNFVFYRKTVGDKIAGQPTPGESQLFVRETCHEPEAADLDPVIHLQVRHASSEATNDPSSHQSCTVASQPSGAATRAVLSAPRRGS